MGFCPGPRAARPKLLLRTGLGAWLTPPRGPCALTVLAFSMTAAAMTVSLLGKDLSSCLHSSCTTRRLSPGPAAAGSTSPASLSKSGGVGGRGPFLWRSLQGCGEGHCRALVGAPKALSAPGWRAWRRAGEGPAKRRGAGEAGVGGGPGGWFAADKGAGILLWGDLTQTILEGSAELPFALEGPEP